MHTRADTWTDPSHNPCSNLFLAPSISRCQHRLGPHSATPTLLPLPQSSIPPPTHIPRALTGSWRHSSVTGVGVDSGRWFPCISPVPDAGASTWSPRTTCLPTTTTTTKCIHLHYSIRSTSIPIRKINPREGKLLLNTMQKTQEAKVERGSPWTHFKPN